jgi:hypothetical protein
MALRVWGYKQGEVVSLMIHLGDRLGIYQALDGAGPVTAEALAARTGLHPRWLLEWLRGQAAAGLVESADGQVFELSREAAALLPMRRAACGSRPAPSTAPPPLRKPWTGSPNRSAPAAASASMTSARTWQARSSARWVPGHGSR